MAKQTVEQVEKNLKAVLGGGVTQEQFDAWKQEYGEVRVVTVKLNEHQTLTGYFKKPKRAVYANCINLANQGSLFEAQEFLLTNTFIGGDAIITTNEDASLSAQNKLWKSVNFLPAEVTIY